jgi:hypothetical protein
LRGRCDNSSSCFSFSRGRLLRRRPFGRGMLGALLLRPPPGRADPHGLQERGHGGKLYERVLKRRPPPFFNFVNLIYCSALAESSPSSPPPLSLFLYIFPAIPVISIFSLGSQELHKRIINTTSAKFTPPFFVLRCLATFRVSSLLRQRTIYTLFSPFYRSLESGLFMILALG